MSVVFSEKQASSKHQAIFAKRKIEVFAGPGEDLLSKIIQIDRPATRKHRTQRAKAQLLPIYTGINSFRGVTEGRFDSSKLKIGVIM